MVPLLLDTTDSVAGRLTADAIEDAEEARA